MVQSQEGWLKIGAVARQAHVSIDTVRYYERRGILGPAMRLPSGYRLYADTVVATIDLARRLQGLGMTLDEIADALQAHDRGHATCESERWRLQSVLDRTRARLSELAAVQANLETTLAHCDSGHCELRTTQQPAATD